MTISLLVVDDKESDRNIIKSFFSTSCQVSEASTTEEAIDWLKRKKFDCIIMDYQLNNIWSIDLAKKLREHDNTVPIIISAADGCELVALDALESGMTYMPKSKMTVDLLSRAIYSVIKFSRQQQQQNSELAYFIRFYQFAPVGFYTTTIKDGTFLRANDFCVKLFGFNTFEELSNFKSTQFYEVEKRQELLKLVKNGNRVKDFEVELTLLNGEKKWVIITSQLCPEGDCIEGSLTDITETKRIEEELESYKSRDTLKIIRDEVKEKLKFYN